MVIRHDKHVVSMIFLPLN